MINAELVAASRKMDDETALMMLRRKPQTQAEYRVCRAAVACLARSGYSKREIQAEAGRKLTFPEELAICEAGV